MSDNRFVCGVVLSVLWLFVIGLVMHVYLWPSTLNEWGDFLAGASAPLAFLWLVLGYLQQGAELRQSTEALRLQAKELASTVKQQTVIAETSRKQLEHSMRAYDDERKRDQERMRAKFVAHSDSVTAVGADVTFKVVITNAGARATQIEIRLSPHTDTFVSQSFAAFEAGHTQFIELRKLGTRQRELSIKYVDPDGTPRTRRFLLQVNGRDLKMTDR